MVDGKRITLDPRLSMIAEMVGRCDVYADIGCDHGRLGAFLLQRGWVKRSLMMDISRPSIQKAKALVRLLGFEDRVRFYVGDGADGLDEPVDVVVLAGMGGDTAARIVERGRSRIGQARLIIQANVAIPELRERLTGMGYRIVDERIVRDGRRLYVILEVVPGEMRLSLEERVVGPVLLKHRPVELTEYAIFRLRVVQKALEGAARGGDIERTSALRSEERIWEDLVLCL